MTESAIVARALACFKLASTTEEPQRKRELEDLQFQVPEMQWPEDVKAQRQAQSVNGTVIPARPMLSISKLDQPVQLVLNQEKAAHLGVQVHPLSEDATDDTAEIIQGLYRQIERDSRANLARSWAFERAVKCGRGVYRVNKVYDDSTGNPSDQKIVLQRILYQNSVYLDPAAQEPDGSDAQWALVVEDMPWRKYTRLFPKSDMATWDDSDFSDFSNQEAAWITGDGEGRAVKVAEYFWIEYADDEQVQLDDHSFAYKSAIPEGKKQAADGYSRPVQQQRVMWCKVNGIEELSEPIQWDGKYIPFIPVIGRELQPFDKERRFVGIIGPAKDAQRLFNYSITSAVEKEALDTKAPWIMAEGQQEGHEQQFLQANVRNFPYLLYKPTSLAGTPNPPPQRNVVGANISASLELAMQASDALKATTAVFDPSLGNTKPSQQSGKMVLALQQQADASNSHYLDQLAEVSMTHEARVVIDLMKAVYDREGRIAQIVGQEDKQSAVMLNAPYTVDPQSKRPMAAIGAQPGQPVKGEVKHHDLKKGIYGVSISIGKSYQTKQQQGADAFSQIIQADPALMQILGDLWFKVQDFPGHIEAADRLHKMLPPQLQEDQGQNDPKMLQQKLQQIMKQHEMLVKELEAKTQALQTDQAKYAAQVQIAQFKESSAVQLQKMKDATSIVVAQINALTKGVTLDTEAQNEAIALAAQQAHEAIQSALDRQHEVGMGAAGQAADAQASAQDHQQGLEAGDQQHAQALEQGDQSHQQALEQGDQGHAQALEQNQQQADLAPPPDAGAGQ